MNCNNFLTQISAYIDNELSPEMKKGCEAHAAECEKCSAMLNSFRKNDAALREIPEFVPSLQAFSTIIHPPSISLLKNMKWAFILSMFILLFSFCLIDRNMQKNNPETAKNDIHYNISLNDSKYNITVTGKEVRLLSFEMSENNDSSIEMSFEKKENNDEKNNNSFMGGDFFALSRQDIIGGRDGNV